MFYESVLKMKISRIIISFLFVFLLTCFENRAGIEEEFEKDLKESAGILARIYTKVEAMDEAEKPNYLGNIPKQKFKELLEVFFWAKDSIQQTQQFDFKGIIELLRKREAEAVAPSDFTPLQSTSSKGITTHTKIRGTVMEDVWKRYYKDQGLPLFLVYCRGLHIESALHKCEATALSMPLSSSPSPALQDIEEALKALAIYQKHFSEPSEFLASHLYVEPLKVIYTPNYTHVRKIPPYIVKINYVAMYFSMRRIANTLLTAIKSIDPNKLIGSQDYKTQLSLFLEDAKTKC